MKSLVSTPAVICCCCCCFCVHHVDPPADVAFAAAAAGVQQELKAVALGKKAGKEERGDRRRWRCSLLLW
jgi:hypothetical protein